MCKFFCDHIPAPLLTGADIFKQVDFPFYFVGSSSDCWHGNVPAAIFRNTLFLLHVQHCFAGDGNTFLTHLRSRSAICGDPLGGIKFSSVFHVRYRWNLMDTVNSSISFLLLGILEVVSAAENGIGQEFWLLSSLYLFFNFVFYFRSTVARSVMASRPHGINSCLTISSLYMCTYRKDLCTCL